MINVALPKGRIGEKTLEIFSNIFNERFVFNDRKLILQKEKFLFMLVRSQDVLTYVYHQAADVGIVGLDVLEENPYNVLRLLDLGFGKCRVVVGAPKDRGIDYLRPRLKIATKMPNITMKYFSQQAIAVDVIKLYGSIELAPLVGLCDGIVDIVETGNTMRQNNLIETNKIMDSTANLICNNNSFYAKKDEVLELCGRIKQHLSL